MNNKADIVKVLENRIISGEYAIGEALKSERVLAEEFGVSKTVMHEAMMVLKEKKLIESKARSRNTVTDWVRNADINVFQVLLDCAEDNVTEDIAKAFAGFRIFNEGKCAALAAQNRTDEDLALMKEALDRIETATSVTEFAAALTDFHHRIFNASGNKLYAIIFGTFHHLIEKWEEKMFPDWENYNIATIRYIYNAIERRNAINAECTMTAYTTEGAMRLSKVSRKRVN